MDTWNIFPSNNIMEMWKWVEIMETYGISHQKPWEFVWKYGTSFHSLAKHRFPQKKLPIGGCTTPFSETPNYHISGIKSNLYPNYIPFLAGEIPLSPIEQQITIFADKRH